jgi:hypothetical protein
VRILFEAMAFTYDLETDVDVRARDRIVIGSISYAVLFVRDAAGAGHHLELDLEMIEP